MRPMHIEYNFFRWFQFAIGFGIAFTLFLALFYLIAKQDFHSTASVIVSIAAIYIALAALFFNRARALPRGPSKVRSLYIAERIVQAIAFTLFGVLIGVSIFACGNYFAAAAGISSSEPHPWLFLFLVPFVFIGWGYGSFLLALRVICREFLHPLSAREISRRVKNAP